MSEKGAITVALDAATPTEEKSGGAGWSIIAGYADTPFGACLIAECPRGICHLSFEYSGAWDELQAQWPNAELVRDDQWAGELAGKIFMEGQGSPHRSASVPSLAGRPATLQLFVKGSDFQIKVWRALLEIPSGQSVSYGGLAERIGNPKASRAVGTAVGSNPVAYLIPCHRVIRSDGTLGGYRWGCACKKALQVWEGA